MSARQYGFTRRKLTEQASDYVVTKAREAMDNGEVLLAINLDVSGAFDNARWPDILRQLSDKTSPEFIQEIIADYFTDRTVYLRYNGTLYQRELQKGCPQGSVLGPQLWLLLMDTLLCGHFPEECEPVAFADDLILLIRANDAKAMHMKANKCLEQASEWANRHALKFNTTKSSATIFTRKLQFTLPTICLYNKPIPITQTFKYLGITIDNKLNFNTHIKNIIAKCENFLKHLSRMATCSWGMGSEALQSIYKGAIEPMATYNGSVWGKALTFRYNKHRLEQMQRKCCIRIAKLYKTVDYKSALILSGMDPITSKIIYLGRMFDIKKLGKYHTSSSILTLEAQVPWQKKLPPQSVILPETDPHPNPDLDIYTDGSKSDAGVGAGYCIFKNDNNYEVEHTAQIKLSTDCSAFQAEIFAILKATDYLIEHTSAHKTRIVNLYSDSQSAISAIQNINTNSPIINKIHNNLILIDLDYLSISWVKGHANIFGNEIADKIAKKASRMKVKPAYAKISLEVIKQKEKEIIKTDLNNIYSTINQDKLIKQIFPNYNNLQNFKKYNKLDWITLQFITGHGKFLSYLHRFNIMESDACQCPEGVPQTPVHLLFDCKLFNDDRNIYKNSVKKLVKDPLTHISKFFHQDSYKHACIFFKKIYIKLDSEF